MTELQFKYFFDNNFDPLRRYLFYRSGNSELASDIAQDAFMKIWEKKISEDGSRTIGLVYKIANDLFVSHYRKNKTESNYLKSIQFDLSSESTDDEIHLKELKDKFERTLLDIGEKQRIVFLMSRMDGLKNKEIAERLGISVKAVEKRMSIALSILRKGILIIYLIFLKLVDTLI